MGRSYNTSLITATTRGQRVGLCNKFNFSLPPEMNERGISNFLLPCLSVINPYLKIPCHSILWCFNIGISGPQTQYSKTSPKFSRGAELQSLRNSRTLSFPQTRCFGGRVKAGQGGGWGCGPEQLVATDSTMRSVYGGCIAMARRNPYYA